MKKIKKPLIKFISDFELYLNKDATLNYIIMVEMMEGMDNFGKNMVMVTYDGKIWYPSLYDLDSTWGTSTSGEMMDSYDYLAENLGNNLIARTIKCFSNEYATRWFELRKDILSKDNIIKEFNDFLDDIPSETHKKEEQRWGKEIPGYGIDQIEEFVNYRLKCIDDIMEEKTENDDVKIKVSKQEEKTNTDDEDDRLSIILYIFIFIIVICTILIYIKNE